MQLVVLPTAGSTDVKSVIVTARLADATEVAPTATSQDAIHVTSDILGKRTTQQMWVDAFGSS
jgi:hypothetical protein